MIHTSRRITHRNRNRRSGDVLYLLNHRSEREPASRREDLATDNRFLARREYELVTFFLHQLNQVAFVFGTDQLKTLRKNSITLGKPIILRPKESRISVIAKREGPIRANRIGATCLYRLGVLHHVRVSRLDNNELRVVSQFIPQSMFRHTLGARSNEEQLDLCTTDWFVEFGRIDRLAINLHDHGFQ